MKRAALLLGGVFFALALVLAAAIIIAAMNLSAIVKRGVNTYGPALTKTELRLGDAAIDLFEGRVVLRDLFIGNPPGYSTPSLLTAATITLCVRPGSVFSNPLVIERCEIETPVINFEKNGASDNFKTVLENMDPGSGGGRKSHASKAPSQGHGRGRTVVIRDFSMRNASVTASLMLLKNKKITMVLPELHLQNIGQAAGAQPRDIARQALAAVYESVLANAGPGKAMVQATGESTKSAGQGITKGFEKAAEGLKKLFGR